MKTYKPTTPSRRNMTGINYRKVLTSSKPLKSLTKGVKRAVGRASSGRITTRHKGSGHKRVYREIDFKLDKKDIPFKVATIEYDPNRTGFVGVVNYKDGEKRYMLLPSGIKVGDELIISEKAEIKPGNRLSLKNIQVGTFVYNIEIKAGNGAKLVRGAGSYAEVVAKDAGYTHLKMPSSEIRKIPEDCFATIGQVSNDEHHLVKIGKAGRNRWKGKRPTVRGMAMNAVDHPMGGGEARGRGSRKHKKNRQGKIVDPGKKSRKPKKYSNFLVVKRRKGKRRK